jgi:hypothetical protein
MTTFLDLPKEPAAITITNDGGGLVYLYEQAVWRYRAQKRPVVINGSCRSACTLALAVPTVCVTPNAVVKFHHAYDTATGEPRLDVTEQMLGELPSQIAKAVRGKIGVNYSPEATLDFNRLVSLGVKACEEGRVATANTKTPTDNTNSATKTPSYLVSVAPETRPYNVSEPVVKQYEINSQKRIRPVELMARTAVMVAALPVTLLLGFARGISRSTR